MGNPAGGQRPTDGQSPAGVQNPAGGRSPEGGQSPEDGQSPACAKNRQVQTCKTRKADPPSTKGKPKTRRSKSTARSDKKSPKSTPSTRKKSCSYKVQSSKIENFGVKLLSAAKALPICESPEFDTLKLIF